MNHDNGKYATIHRTKSGLYQGTIHEVWEGYKFYINHTTDTTIDGVKHCLHHKYGIKNIITLDK
jgi:hypothetical protein